MRRCRHVQPTAFSFLRPFCHRLRRRRSSTGFFRFSALAQHRPLPRRTDARDLRRAVAAERFLYGAGERRRISSTDDYGRTWQPIFDDQPTAQSARSRSRFRIRTSSTSGAAKDLHRPDLSVGNGIYKSTDAGKTWTHLGLRDGQQIAQIAVDPRNPDHLLVAVAGHPYGPNEERGIFLSTDGGKTFAKTLYKDENTGGSDVQIDPTNPQIVYASLWEAREGPWENAEWNGTNGGIFKSTDGGKTWKQLKQRPA